LLEFVASFFHSVERENRRTFDSSVSLAPAGFVAAVSYVVNSFDQLFPNQVTFSIHVGYGKLTAKRWTHPPSAKVNST
jgi:hypothetical protein